MAGFTDGSASGHGFVRKMAGFTDGRWSECEVIRKMAVFTDGEPFRVDLMVTKGDES